jgi:hypothetical protein
LTFENPKLHTKTFSAHTMRNTLIFAGSSCPALTDQICEKLGMAAADAELGQFSNVRTLSISSFPEAPTPTQIDNYLFQLVRLADS